MNQTELKEYLQSQSKKINDNNTAIELDASLRPEDINSALLSMGWEESYRETHRLNDCFISYCDSKDDTIHLTFYYNGFYRRNFFVAEGKLIFPI